VEAAFAEARDRRTCELGGTAAPRSGIHYGEKCFSHLGAASHRSQLTEQKLRQLPVAADAAGTR
jgi:hypothetical protein